MVYRVERVDVHVERGCGQLVLFSLAVGGLFGRGFYQRSGQVDAPWIKRLILDAAIFILGYYETARKLLLENNL